MARDIDFSKPLSDADRAYVDQRPWLKTNIEIETGLPFETIASEGVGEEEDEEVLDGEVEEVDLDTLTKPELIELAKERELDTSGNKADLIARIIEFEQENEDKGDEG